MISRSTKIIFTAAAAILTLGGCELIAGLEGTDLAQNPADGAPPSSDVVVPDDVVSIPDAGPVGHPIGDHDETCAYGGSSTLMTVACNPGQVITGVTTALFGRFDGSCTSGFSPTDGGSCNPADATGDAGAGKRYLSTVEAIEALCDGLRECTFDPAHLIPVLNDPCPGTGKQFAVQITCGTEVDAGVDAGNPASGMVLDLDAHDIASLGIGASIAAWKNKLANETATPAASGAPVVAQTDDGLAEPVARFVGGHALTLPVSNASDPYLKDFSQGVTALAVIAPRERAFTGEHIFDFGNTSNADTIYLGANGLGLTAGSHGVSSPPLTPSEEVAVGGQWNVDYLQLLSFIVRPLAADIATAGNSGGVAWGRAAIYEGTTPLAVGFLPIPEKVDRLTNLLGTSNTAGAPALEGDLGELVVYNRGLGDVELATEQTALATTWHLCDGANFQNDPANCGGCGHICTAGSICDFGVCTEANLESWSIANPSSGDAGFLIGPSDGDGGTQPVSWAQARNTCLLEGSDLGAPTAHDDDLILKGYFDQTPITRDRAVGFIRENSVPLDAATLGAVVPDWSSFESGGAYGCVDMKGDGNWTTSSGCNTSGARGWACQEPAVAFPASCPIFTDVPPSTHAYGFCRGPFANEVARKKACSTIGGRELVVQNFPQATNVGLLQMGTTLAVDLTNARKSPSWTLGDGSAAPFIGWDSSFNPSASIPPYVVGPACTFLNGDGTMTDQSCFASGSVACGLADGTPAPTTIPSTHNGIPGFIDMIISMNDMTHAPASGQGTSVLTGVQPGDSISGSISFYEVGRNFTLKVGFYPSTASVCQLEFTNFPAGVYSYAPINFTFTAGPLLGVYTLDTYPDSDCSPGWSDRSQHGVTSIGAIEVVAP